MIAARKAGVLEQKDLDPIGVNLESQFGIIGAPRPPAQVIAAINMKVQATQLAIQKQNELVQVQADAAKAVAKAEGEAKATIIEGEAAARYNQLVNASLTPLLISNRAITQWDGQMPTYVTSGGALPFIGVK